MYISMYNLLVSKSKRYSIAEARAKLPAIVDQAEAGREIQLMRRGKPVAVVVSIAELEKLRSERPSFAAAYRRFVARHAPADLGLDRRFFDAIREKETGRDVKL
jgi:prevent-host-death family protein